MVHLGFFDTFTNSYLPYKVESVCSMCPLEATFCMCVCVCGGGGGGGGKFGKKNRFRHRTRGDDSIVISRYTTHSWPGLCVFSATCIWSVLTSSHRSHVFQFVFYWQAVPTSRVLNAPSTSSRPAAIPEGSDGDNDATPNPAEYSPHRSVVSIPSHNSTAITVTSPRASTLTQPASPGLGGPPDEGRTADSQPIDFEILQAEVLPPVSQSGMAKSGQLESEIANILGTIIWI